MDIEELTLFDLYVANPVRALSQPAGTAVDMDRFGARGLVQLAVSLVEARKLLKTVRHHGGNVYIVPVAYRKSVVSIEEARANALTVHARLIGEGTRLGDLDEGFDDFLWWTFCADDLNALENDLIPGRICISIDKLDGHIRSPDELQDWLGLSSM